jgi:hypothetical protein
VDYFRIALSFRSFYDSMDTSRLFTRNHNYAVLNKQSSGAAVFRSLFVTVGNFDQYVLGPGLAQEFYAHQDAERGRRRSEKSY